MAVASQGGDSLAQAKADILLESGTNELEVLVFRVGDGIFGINVAKVREVILPLKITAGPEQHPSVLGMFNLRGHVLPLVDLHRYFGTQPAEDVDAKDLRIIVTEFNGQQCAFRVDGVEQIYRMSWKNMKPVPEVSNDQAFAITGITQIDDRLVLMLDFESVVDHINLQDSLHVDFVENQLGVNRDTLRVLVAEDSNFVRSLMERVLLSSGYIQVTSFTNGKDAWDALQQASQSDEESNFDLAIADIEMPMMDGYALTRHIKNDPQLKDMPVVLFSSLISEDTRHKGKQVGASDQIAKPQLPDLVRLVDQWLARLEQGETASGASVDAEDPPAAAETAA